MAQRRLSAYLLVSEDDCPSLFSARKHQKRQRPSLRLTLSPPSTFALDSSFFLNASSAPIQRLGEEKSCAAKCLSNIDAKRRFRLEALVLDDQGRFPGRFIFALTPFGIGSHGIVHVLGCPCRPRREFGAPMPSDAPNPKSAFYAGAKCTHVTAHIEGP